MIDSIKENTKEKLEKIQEEKKKIRREIRNQTFTLIMTSFGFVAGLAWNEAVKAFIELFFPPTHSGLVAKLIYAVFVTLLVVIASSLFSKMRQEEQK